MEGTLSRGLAAWSVEEVFRKLISSNQPAYANSDLIVDWIVRARPSQHEVDQVFSEVEADQLNASYTAFLGDVVRARGYSTPQLLLAPGTKYYNSYLEQIPPHKVQDILYTTLYTLFTLLGEFSVFLYSSQQRLTVYIAGKGGVQ